MDQFDEIIEHGAGTRKSVSNNITCQDGFTLSVVANEFAYCSPRSDVGPYGAVEVGFPSEKPRPWKKTWKGYASSPEHPTGTVYGWVPVEVVRALIERHGGIA